MFKYFGGKQRLARHYPQPRYEQIVEPFAGAAAYSVHHRYRNAILIERDPRIVALWHQLLGMTPDVIRAMPDPTAGGRDDRLLVALAAARTTGDTPEWFDVSPRMAQRFRPMVNRIASVVDECRHFDVRAGDYMDAPMVDATWFVDPPYQYQGGRRDRTRGGRYRFGNDLIDYAQLGEWCRSLPGQVIVCEQHGADWLPFRPFLDTVNGLHDRYSEVVWTNE